MRAHRPAHRALLGLAGSVCLLVALAACTDASPPEPSPTDGGTTSAEATDSPTDDASEPTEPTDDATSEEDDGDGTPGIEDVPTADVGACLNLADVLSTGGVSDIPTVDCTEEHDAQVFAVVELPDGDFPGDDAIATSISDECEAAFEGFIGTPPTDSALSFDGLGPSEATWSVGDREIICLAFYEDVTTMTESLEGSGI